VRQGLVFTNKKLTHEGQEGKKKLSGKKGKKLRKKQKKSKESNFQAKGNEEERTNAVGTSREGTTRKITTIISCKVIMVGKIIDIIAFEKPAQPLNKFAKKVNFA